MPLLARLSDTGMILSRLVPIVLSFSLAACVSESRQPTATARDVQLKGRGTTVLAAGDIADCRKATPAASGAAKTAALITPVLESDPEAIVLALGDQTYPIGLLSEFQECYEPTWGGFKSRTWAIPGNHEYYSPHAGGYFAYFGERAGAPQRGYYSLRKGNWLLIAMNSNLKPDDHARQLAWLKEELAAKPARCTLAFWHHPLYSSGGHGSNNRMTEAWSILQDAGAELVLSAHDHDYERFAPQDSAGQRDDARGMRQFVIGTGGATLTPFRFPKPHAEYRNNLSLGVLKLTLKEAGYEWEFLPVDADGERDRGSALCH